MLVLMLYSIKSGVPESEDEEEVEFETDYLQGLAVEIVKFPCAIALHLVLYPEVRKGMRIMKFSNNQYDQFVSGGSEISFFIGMS